MVISIFLNFFIEELLQFIWCWKKQSNLNFANLVKKIIYRIINRKEEFWNNFKHPAAAAVYTLIIIVEDWLHCCFNIDLFYFCKRLLFLKDFVLDKVLISSLWSERLVLCHIRRDFCEDHISTYQRY